MVIASEIEVAPLGPKLLYPIISTSFLQRLIDLKLLLIFKALHIGIIPFSPMLFHPKLY